MARIDDFKARFPSFDTAVVDSIFPVIEPLSACYYGGDYDNNACDKEIFMQLWAHQITIENRASDGSVRNVASKAVGSVNVSYEASQAETGRMGWFNTTRYGQQFLLLTSTNQGAKFV
jgi:hypothetical protein